MHTNSIQICYASWHVPPLQSSNCFLMEDFGNQDFPWYKLKKLNACRMFLQVTTLSEILDHTGTKLLPQILTTSTNDFPKGLINISQSTLNWPFVSCPSPTCWRIWTSTVCMLYTGLAKGTWLTQPMGPWLETYDQT